LRDVLCQLQTHAREAGGRIELLTGVAAGADLDAADTANELGIAVHVILPIPVEMFEDDFTGELKAEWPRAQQWIESAQGGVDGGTFRIATGDNTRPDCYHEASVQMLGSIDLLVAVCNDEPAEGIGGTAETIQQARELNLPVYRINPESHQIDEPDQPKTWTQFNQVTCETLAVCEQAHSPGSKSIEGGIEAIQSSLSERADRLGKGFRYRLFLAIGMHLLAAILATTTATFSPVIHHHEKSAAPTAHATDTQYDKYAEQAIDGKHAGQTDHSGIHFGIPQALTAIELILVCLALWLTIQVLRGHLHHSWRRARFATELVRGLRATSQILDPLDPLVLRHNPDWRRFVISVALQAHRDAASADSATERLVHYLEERVQDQHDYFLKAHNKSQPWATWLGRLGMFSTITAPLFIGIAFGIKLFASDSVETSYLSAWLAVWLPVFIPLVAASASTLLIAGDFARRKERYRIMVQRLSRSQRLLSTLKTPGAVYRHVEETEEILLDELVEWYAAAKNMGH
jgi:hypothetical protein